MERSATLWLLLGTFFVASESVGIGGKTVNRLTHGVIFRETETIALSNQYWEHTFQFPFPEGDVQLLGPEDCHSAKYKTTCEVHNEYIKSFNRLAVSLNKKIQETRYTIRQIIGSEITMSVPSRSSSTSSRSKRSLLPFVGDLGSSLFGWATESQIRTLARHVQEIQKVQNSYNSNAHANMEEMRGFMKNANDRMDNLKKLINVDHEALTDLTNSVAGFSGELNLLERDVASVIPMLINRTEMHVIMSQELEGLVVALHELIQRKLPPRLIPEKALIEALERTEVALHRQYPYWNIVYKSAAYFYGQRNLIYGIHDNNLYVTIFIPISPVTEIYDIYQLLPLGMPINQSTDHITVIDSPLPPFLALSTDGLTFLELNEKDRLGCKGTPVKTCSILQGTRRTSSPSCALSLFHNKDILSHCDYGVREGRPDPLFMELEPGLAVVANTQEFLETCVERTLKHQGCLLCVINLKCGCSYTTERFVIKARLDNCSNLTSTSKRYPVNLPVLNNFFNDSQLAHLVDKITHEEPVPFEIPALKIANRKFKDASGKDDELKISLKKAVSAMKKGETVYRQLPDWDLDELVSSSDSWVHWSFTYVNLGLTAIVIVGMVLVYRRVQALTLLLTAQIKLVNSLTTDIPAKILKYDAEVSKTTANKDIEVCHPTVSASVVGSLQILTVIMMVILAMKIWRYISNNSKDTAAKLLFSGMAGRVEIELMTLPLFPTDYVSFIEQPPSKLEIVNRRFGRGILKITWPNFFIKEIETREMIPLPKSLKLSIRQTKILDKMFDQHFVVHVLLIHDKMTVFLKRTEGAEIGEGGNDLPSLPSLGQPPSFFHNPSAPNEGRRI